MLGGLAAAAAAAAAAVVAASAAAANDAASAAAAVAAAANAAGAGSSFAESQSRHYRSERAAVPFSRCLKYGSQGQACWRDWHHLGP